MSESVARFLTGSTKKPCARPVLTDSGSAKANTRVTHIKNYTFDFDFGQPWGTCSVTMTCVVGHLTNLDFPSDYKNWQFPPPDRLFGAPVNTIIQPVSVKENKATMAGVSVVCGVV